MKRILIATLALALVAGSGSAAVAGKKKKGPKPYKSETVSIATGHTVLNSASGSVLSVTAQEFMARCALPDSNGLDAYVFEVPKEYQSITSAIQATGAGAPVPHDLDIYLFDSSCAITVAFNTETADESGLLPVGTAFILIHNYQPGPVDAAFTLKPI